MGLTNLSLPLFLVLVSIAIGASATAYDGYDPKYPNVEGGPTYGSTPSLDEPKANPEKPYTYYGEEDPLATPEKPEVAPDEKVHEIPEKEDGSNVKAPKLEVVVGAHVNLPKTTGKPEVVDGSHDQEKEQLEKTPEIPEKEDVSNVNYAPKPSLEEPEKDVPEEPKSSPEQNPEIPLKEDETHEKLPKPALEKPEKFDEPKKYGEQEKPEVEEEKKQYSNIGVQGVVYCRSGSELTPLQGAVTRITCLNVDKDGYELAPFSMLSNPTDEKGYFYATIGSKKGVYKISDCRVFLNSSPSQTCNVPTDVNMGLSGAVPSSYRLLVNKNTKLYSVGPFFYTTETKPN